MVPALNNGYLKLDEPVMQPNKSEHGVEAGVTLLLPVAFLTQPIFFYKPVLLPAER